MPWTPREFAKKHNKRLNGKPKKQRQAAHVANSVLKRTGDEGRAIRAANAVVGRKKKGRRRSSR